MFAALLGVSDLVTDFFISCFPSSPPALFDDDFIGWLRQQLESQSVSAASYIGVVDSFIQVTHSQLNRGELAQHRIGEAFIPTEEPTIYADRRCLNFDSRAFCSVCRMLGESRPVILQELKQAGMLLGAPINAGTPMSRITLRDEQGSPHCIPVYRLDRSFFDQFGDLTILDV